MKVVIQGLYAELIDFNVDGNHELYLFYIDYSSDYGRTKCIKEYKISKNKSRN